MIAEKSSPKILLLNGYHDRETEGLSALDFVTAITHALNRSVLHPQNNSDSTPLVDGITLPREPYLSTRFITHVCHVNDGTIHLDEAELSQRGIRLVAVQAQADKPGHYDVKELIRTLAEILSEGT